MKFPIQLPILVFVVNCDDPILSGGHVFYHGSHFWRVQLQLG